MVQHSIKVTSGLLLLSSLFLVGCGGSVSRENSAPQAHNTIKHSKTTGGSQESDWTWYVDTQASFETLNAGSTFKITTNFAQAVPAEVKHFQYFIDIDGKEATGFSYGQDSWRISGADYLVEDGELYKSRSHSQWKWQHIGSFEHFSYSNQKRIIFSSSNQLITSLMNKSSINITIEPFDANWESTYSTISTQSVLVDGSIQGEENPNPDNQGGGEHPDPDNGGGENPAPVVDETVYEDAENGLNAGWITTKGAGIATRKTPGYKNNSLAFVKLPNHWTQNAEGRWSNSAEYQLPIHDTKHTILSIDIVGDGTQVEHYVLGVKTTTSHGIRYLFWDSYYNHEHIPARITRYGNDAYIVSPSPVELVRGYDYSNPYLSENFTVDLEATLKKFEPNNRIISVDTFIATGGQLDNIKLLAD